MVVAPPAATPRWTGGGARHRPVVGNRQRGSTPRLVMFLPLGDPPYSTPRAGQWGGEETPRPGQRDGMTDDEVNTGGWCNQPTRRPSARVAADSQILSNGAPDWSKSDIMAVIPQLRAQGITARLGEDGPGRAPNNMPRTWLAVVPRTWPTRGCCWLIHRRPTRPRLSTVRGIQAPQGDLWLRTSSTPAEVGSWALHAGAATERWCGD